MFVVVVFCLEGGAVVCSFLFVFCFVIVGFVVVVWLVGWLVFGTVCACVAFSKGIGKEVCISK